MRLGRRIDGRVDNGYEWLARGESTKRSVVFVQFGPIFVQVRGVFLGWRLQDQVLVGKKRGIVGDLEVNRVGRWRETEGRIEDEVRVTCDVFAMHRDTFSLCRVPFPLVSQMSPLLFLAAFTSFVARFLCMPLVFLRSLALPPSLPLSMSLLLQPSSHSQSAAEERGNPGTHPSFFYSLSCFFRMFSARTFFWSVARFFPAGFLRLIAYFLRM